MSEWTKEEATEFELILYHLPPSELNPNVLRKLHWTRRREVTQSAREEAGWMAKQAWKDREPFEKVTVSYQFTVRDGRKHDVDNLVSACKPYVDGLIDANVMMSDDYRYMKIGGAEIVKGEGYQTRILVRILE